MCHLFVESVIEKNGLIDWNPSENWKDRKKDAFGLNPKSMVGDSGKEEDEDNNHEKGKPLFHIPIQL